MFASSSTTRTWGCASGCITALDAIIVATARAGGLTQILHSLGARVSRAIPSNETTRDRGRFGTLRGACHWEALMVRFKTIAVAVLVAALAAGSALAQGQRAGGPGREGRGGGPFAGLPLASLNLTQAQQDQIQSIRERSRAEMEALQERTRNEVLGVL